MKITNIKNYKKPLYAIGLSAVIMAVAVTGCTKPEKGDVQLGGAAEVREDEQETETTTEPIISEAGIICVDTDHETEEEN